MNGTNHLQLVSMLAVCMFKNKIDKHLIRADENIWTLNQPMASLSTYLLGLLPWMVILLNLVKLNCVLRMY